MRSRGAVAREITAALGLASRARKVVTASHAERRDNQADSNPQPEEFGSQNRETLPWMNTDHPYEVTASRGLRQWRESLALAKGY